MKRIKFISLCIIGLFTAVIFSNCTTARNYDFSLQNTLAIFLVNNEKDRYFYIPVQYIGDYHIKSFEFLSCYVLIGDQKILFNKKDVNVNVYLNENSDEYGNTDGLFTLIYTQEKGKVLLSKMSEPIIKSHVPTNTMNQYCIIVDKLIKNSEMKKIIKEYEKGNTHSSFYLEYTVTIDNEELDRCGILDDFELRDGIALETAWFPANLEFFRAKVLQK
jgi:hypothetical protein